MTDTRPQTTALKAALDTACTAAVYEYDEVPGTNGRPGIEPDQYLVLSVERRFGGILQGSARATSTGWRAAVRSVAKNIENVELGLSEASTALNEQRVTVGSESTTPIQFEVAQAPVWDDPRYTALATYTYAY